MEKVAKFKVGDLVRVKKDLKSIRHFECGYNSDMKDYEGKVYEISSVRNSAGYDQVVYTLKNDENYFSWDERAFEHANTLTRDELKFGDIITLRNETRYVLADDILHGEDCGYDSDEDNIYDVYNDDLTYDDSDEDMREYDIVKVERNGSVIFAIDKEPVEMTVAEISEKLGYEVKIVKEK